MEKGSQKVEQRCFWDIHMTKQKIKGKIKDLNIENENNGRCTKNGENGGICWIKQIKF